MNVKEKITEILQKERYEKCILHGYCPSCEYRKEKYCQEQMLADKLIAANIGDITEWKQRAEIAEQNFEAIAKYYATDGISFCEVYRAKKDQEMCPNTGKGYLDCGSKKCIESLKQFYTDKSLKITKENQN